ncbi:MAG: fasciclin domain-containing protein [Bacteroidaceae bacterium]|nr:fasciclin domain-containing protein [Bacteroidaceae bacterium]
MMTYYLKHIFQKGLILMAGLVMLHACTEEVDTSNRYTFTEETVLSYLEKNEQYSEYVKLLRAVNISDYSESNVAQLLSARGYFTCFAPNNDAIQDYLDTLYRKGIISEASWEGFPKDDEGHTLDSIQKVIVYNSIIDGGDVKYYETSDFPQKDNGEFDIANMNDRKLTIVKGKVNTDSIFINGEYPLSMKNRDIEAINGRIHEMMKVIAPSNDTMADIFHQWAKEGHTQFTVLAKLIVACGLSDTLSKTRDEQWEYIYLNKTYEDIGLFKGEAGSNLPPEHRKYGFTIFGETDAVWESELDKPAKEITPEDVEQYLEQKAVYPNAKPRKPGEKEDVYKNTDNLLNQFVTYHIIPARISRNQLVVHYNEKGYNYSIPTQQPTVATEEFYTTMGKRRLLKVFESFESKGVYLNRFPVLRNGRGRFSEENENINDYHESGDFFEESGNVFRMKDYMPKDENRGIKVEEESDTTSTKMGTNGIIYPIRKMLAYTENVQNQLHNQRIRIDIASILTEMMTNDVRRPLVSYTIGHATYRAFPTNYQYFNDLEIKKGTRFYYLNGLGYNWFNWQGDEFNIKGRYEFTLRLPPVPTEGQYELRLKVQSNSNLRGMCQVYWGSDKNNLPAIGIPLDMRMGGVERHLYSTNQPSIVGWKEDTGDRETDDEVDKKMRNNGFMKGPEHYCNVPGGSETIRTKPDAIRRIMVSAWMKPDVTYYLKFKSVLDDVEKEHYLDYIEYCSKEVYDNPNESEDIW